MSFDKPKVTIDLDEYNHLLSEISELRKNPLSVNIDDYKKAVYECMKHTYNVGGTLDSVNKELRNYGILIILNSDISLNEWARINVVSLKK